ncbi:MAG TPA: lysylphosphatidylglycerol synthase transmembrane domain-containing protein [Planctomycetota bacterium]
MKRVGLTLLKIALVVALGLFVLGQIETRDRLLEPVAGTAPLEHFGDLEGDWQTGGWTFREAGTGQVFEPEGQAAGWDLRPGFFSLLAGIRLGLFGLGVLFWLVLLAIVTLRWQILLRAVEVPTSYPRALRLCFIGYFFNNAMPGLTGGDLVRAVLVTRGLEEKRTRAAMSVLVDRVMGLFSLLLLAGVVLVVADFGSAGGDPPRHLPALRRAVLMVVAVAAVGATIWLSRRARRFVRLDALLARLPARQWVAKIDDAITAYRNAPFAVLAALGLSLILQTFGVLTFWAMAAALGSPISLSGDFVIYPVVQTASSLPIAPAGWGIGETLYGTFFQWFGTSFTLGVAASLLFRLTTQLAVGLVGGLVWLLTREPGDTAVAEAAPELGLAMENSRS